MVTPLATAADERRFIADIVCKRVVTVDFQSGDLPSSDINPEAMKEFYRDRLAASLVNDDEWEDICQRVLCWQELEHGHSRPIHERILCRFSKFPPIERVRDVLGESKALHYKTALEEIENDEKLSALFPNERVSYPWRKFDMDAAVAVVADVMAPNLGNPESMAVAYDELVAELRARRKERMDITAAEFGKRKVLVRALGIWFPITKDIDRWKADPRTAPLMPEFLRVMDLVVERMKLVRSYLQHIPRRRMSTRACDDIEANLERMKAYLRGYATFS